MKEGNLTFLRVEKCNSSAEDEKKRLGGKGRQDRKVEKPGTSPTERIDGEK